LEIARIKKKKKKIANFLWRPARAFFLVIEIVEEPFFKMSLYFYD
jgi:hypothetical protein